MLALALYQSAIYANSANVELAGKTEFEITAYQQEGQFTGQDYRHNLSLGIAPELYWDNANNTVVFTPFLRIDEQDTERTHGDIRELSWVHVADNWEFRTGIRKVFWGVAEFNHLVDVINQTDAVDSFDGEEKLGQPMLNASYVADWGIVDAFALLGFRERTFAGTDGRLRSSLVVDTDNASYESGREEKHIDYALRWSHSLGVFDLGAYYFHGTDRDPQLILQGSRLQPFYQLVDQVGVDLQATVDSWLWKLEAINKSSRADDYWASQAGFEYTFYGVRDSAVDIGMLLEYGWDQRGINGSSTAQDDISLGVRLSLNDVNDSTLLAGITYDRDYHTRSVLIEASRRLTDRWTIALEALVLSTSDTADPVFNLREDDRIQLTLERYF